MNLSDSNINKIKTYVAVSSTVGALVWGYRGAIRKRMDLWQPEQHDKLNLTDATLSAMGGLIMGPFLPLALPGYLVQCYNRYIENNCMYKVLPRCTCLDIPKIPCSLHPFIRKDVNEMEPTRLIDDDIDDWRCACGDIPRRNCRLHTHPYNTTLHNDIYCRSGWRPHAGGFVHRDFDFGRKISPFMVCEKEKSLMSTNRCNKCYACKQSKKCWCLSDTDNPKCNVCLEAYMQGNKLPGYFVEDEQLYYQDPTLPPLHYKQHGEGDVKYAGQVPDEIPANHFQREDGTLGYEPATN